MTAMSGTNLIPAPLPTNGSILQRSDRALLDRRTLGHRSLSVAASLIVVVMITLLGTLILLPIYLQNVLGVDALTTGLMLLSGGLVMGALAPLIGSLFDRFRARVPVTPSTTGLTGARGWMTTLNGASSLSLIIAMHVTMSACLAMMFTPLFAAVMSVTAAQGRHSALLTGTVAAGLSVIVARLLPRHLTGVASERPVAR